MNDLPSILKKITPGPGLGGSVSIVGDLHEPQDSLRSFKDGKGLCEHIDILLQKHHSKISGWLLWSEELQIIIGDGPDGFERGWLLAGELHIAGEKDHSIQISQHWRDWLVRTLTRQEATATDNAPPPAFIETREFIPWPQLAEPQGFKLHYEVAWRLNHALPTPCYRPADFRFVGFTQPPSAPTP